MSAASSIVHDLAPPRSGRVNVSLWIAFALLICLVAAVGFIGLAQMERANERLQSIGRNEFVVLDLAREALKLSALNNRITLQVFFIGDRVEIDRLLVERAANTEQITRLVGKIEAVCGEAEEIALLAEVKAARTPYVQSYKDALKLLMEGGDADGARAIMLERTIPRLVTYHRAWEAFSQYQTDRAARSIATSEGRYASARVMVLQVLAAALLCAFVIAVGSSWKLARETRTRERAQAELRRVYQGLERRVGERTAELAEANVRLQAGLAAREAADENLKQVNVQLLSVSRQAGMAEVATSVLHNVGNVLNSANVSLEIASAKVKGLKAGSLEKLVALLHEHAGDLPAFFTQHAQGVKLPAFLAQISAHLSTEQTAVLREMESLRTNVDHINEIVAMQQRYAGSGGVTEVLSLSEVIEDALRMTGDSLVRHGAGVEREIDAALPALPLDRHKVLQILVNLIRNAAHAMENAPGEARRLTLRAGMEGDQRVRISVSDTGPGIAPENLPRIFSHGFTTKKDGHGFGLHSSALAAREMGGLLGVESEGLGRGATFTLDLPLQASLS